MADKIGFWKRFWNYKFFDKKQKVEERIIKVPETKVEVLKPIIEYKITEPKSNPHELIVIEPYETFKVHDLANMFPFNITPALIESKIQHAIAIKQSMLNKYMTPQFVLLFIMVLMGTVIAAVIAWKFLKQGQTEVIVKLGPGLQNVVTATTSNLTG